MSKKGLLITFEGCEGSGKGTQIKLLKYFLKSKRYGVVRTREPGGTEIGEQIRKILQDNQNRSMFPLTELYLFLASRAQNTYEIIEPALKQGKIVISDRYSHSSDAYQGCGRGVPHQAIDYNHNLIKIIEPDVTFFLDILVKEGLKRKELEGKLDRLESEKLEFHERVREGYLELAKKYKKRIVVLDAEESKEVLHEEIIKTLEERFDL